MKETAPDMQNLVIYDKGKEIVEISPDTSGAIRLIFPEKIGDDTQKKVIDVLAGIKIQSVETQVDDLTKGFKSHGYRVKKVDDEEQTGNKPEAKEATPVQKREADFIYESNLIERVFNIPRKKILRDLVEDKVGGHVSAWRLAKTLGIQKAPLEPEQVCLMQKLITDEQSAFPEHFLAPKYRGKVRDNLVMIGGHVKFPPAEKDYRDFFRRLNEEIKKLDPKNTEAILKFAADKHLEYENMHPFADGNGRTGRLIVNYVMEYFGLPILVFTSSDKHRYYMGFDGDGEMEKYFLEQYKLNNDTYKKQD
jgi:Fic family protein